MQTQNACSSCPDGECGNQLDVLDFDSIYVTQNCPTIHGYDGNNVSNLNSINDAGFSYYSFYNGDLWEHNKNSLRNKFYGSTYDSTIKLIFNDAPSTIKNFKTLN